MSKASDWVKRLEDFIAEGVPELLDAEDERLAHITEYGDMAIDKRGDWGAAEARKLARWITDTFADEERG